MDRTLLPLEHIPDYNVFRDGTRNFADGPVTFAQWDPNLPNGILICQKGPVFPKWDPIWLRGHMFTGRVFHSPVML